MTTKSWAEFNALTTPTPATSPSAILAYSGKLYKGRISPTTGHTVDLSGNSTLVTTLIGLRVQLLKQVGMVMAAGILLGAGTDGDGATGGDYVDRAFKGIETALSFRNGGEIDDGTGVNYTGPTGSFPGQNFAATRNVGLFHAKCIVLDRIAYAFLLFRDSTFNTGSRATTYATLLAQFAESATWMADPTTGNIDRFFRGIEFTNQALRICGLLEKAGVLLNNATMRALSQTQTQYCFDNFMSPDGVLYEGLSRDGIGFDIHYQRLSEEILCDMIVTLPDGAWRDEVIAKLTLAENHWEQFVNPSTGLINATTSTRSAEVFPRHPNSVYFGDNPQGWHTHLVHYILGDGVVPSTLADRIIGVGQQFKHAGDVDDPDPIPLLMSILDATDKAEVEGTSNIVPWRALRPIVRVGGGACAAYPGGILPDPVYILPASVIYSPAHVGHSAYLATLPTLDVSTPGFPPAP